MQSMVCVRFQVDMHFYYYIIWLECSEIQSTDHF